MSYIIANGWKPIQECRVGDRILTLDGHAIAIEGIRDTNTWEVVYNLRVAEWHAYFVGSDSWGVALWAHNANDEYLIVKIEGTNKWTLVDKEGTVVEGAIGREFANPTEAKQFAGKMGVEGNQTIQVSKTVVAKPASVPASRLRVISAEEITTAKIQSTKQAKAGDLVDFVPLSGSNRRPGHARSAHGYDDVNDQLILDIRNNPEKVYAGVNEDGNKVIIFFKEYTVVITDLANPNSVITAFGKNAPGKAGSAPKPRSDIWADDPFYQLLK